MGDPLPALVIGCGRIGSSFDEGAAVAPPASHAGAYARHAGVRLAALCDADAGRVADAARHWDVELACTSVDDALERARPALVSVCTPDETHAAVLERVLQAPGVRAVLAEKPLARTVAEAERIVALAKERGVLLLVNYSRRFHPAYRRLREELAAGVLGEVMLVSGYYSKGVLHNGSHWFDLARWLAGEARVVYASHAFDEYPGDPTVHVDLVFASGARGRLNGMRQSDYALFEVDIMGTRGRVRLLGGPRFEWSVARDSDRYPGFRHLQPLRVDAPAPESAIVAAVDHVIRCLEGGEQPWCDGADGVAAMRLAGEALRLSGARPS